MGGDDNETQETKKEEESARGKKGDTRRLKKDEKMRRWSYQKTRFVRGKSG